MSVGASHFESIGGKSMTIMSRSTVEEGWVRLPSDGIGTTHGTHATSKASEIGSTPPVDGVFWKTDPMSLSICADELSVVSHGDTGK